MLATIYATVVILTTALVFAGDLSISVDSALFVRADNPEVKRNRLARQLQAEEKVTGHGDVTFREDCDVGLGSRRAGS